MSAARNPIRPANSSGALSAAGRPTLAFKPQLTPISVAMCLLVVSPLSFSLPTGPVNTTGQATVQTTAPGQMLIQQSTAKAGLDWTSFSIAAGEKVQVVQPDRTSVLLNRVVGENPSLIYGALQSNGGVWLINPRGIVFGASSRVDVGSLVASTLGINDDALRSGRLQLAAGAGGAGELRSEGSITAVDGSVVLVAPHLVHGGHIEAQRVGLAAASEVLVDVEGDGLIFFNVKNEALDTRLQVLGGVRADGGSAEFRAAARSGFADTVLNLGGVVQARSLGQREGRIVVDGGAHGITRVAGTLDASGASAAGGDVLVQGDKILLTSASRIDTSGAEGGGRLRVGGGFQGKDDAVRNASMVSVAPGARLTADATGRGDGGELVIWSDNATRFFGNADSRGGAAGGNGGLVEVSGKAFLDFRGQSDRSAPRGRAGLLLLDPGELTIRAANPDVNGDGGNLDLGAVPGSTGPGATLAFADPGANSFITAGQVVTQMADGDVVLQATENINVNAAITSASGFSLGLFAGKSINVTQPISVGGNITLSVNDPGAGVSRLATAIANVSAPLSAAGNLTIINNGGTGVHSIAANLTATSLSATGGLNIAGNSVWSFSGSPTLANAVTGTATLEKSGAGVLTLADASGYTGALTVSQGGLSLSGALGSTSITVSNGAALGTTVANLLADTANVAITSGTLTLGDVDTVATLALGGTLAAGGPLTTTGATTLSNGAVVTGGLNAASLASSGTTTVSGAVSVSGTTEISSGAMALSGVLSADTVLLSGGSLTTNATNLLSDNANITVTSGTLTLGGADAVATLALGGTLAGSTLTTSGATTLTNGAVVDGGLIAASLSASGTTAINSAITVTGTTAVTGGTLTLGGLLSSNTVNVDGGVLVLGGNGLLASNAIVTVASGATLSMGGTATINTLVLGGTVSGANTLTTSDLNASIAATTPVIDAAVDVTDDATIASGVVLTLGSGGTTGSMTVANNVTVTGTLAVNRSDAVDLNTLLDSGSAVLGGGTLRQAGTGTLTLNKSVELLGTVQIDGTGGLTLSGASRIGNTATVNVGAGATLTTGGSTETIGTLNLSGTLAGPTDALLATLVQVPAGATGAVTGLLDATNITVDGNLTTGAAGRIGNNRSNNLTVSSGGSLTLGGAEEIGTFSLAGALSGNFTLTANGSTLLTGATVALGTTLSGGALTVNGDATLNGRSTHGNITIGASGTLRLGSAGDRLSNSATMVNNGLLTLAANETIDGYSGTGLVEENGFQFLTQTTTLTSNANNVNATNLIVIGNVRIRGIANVTLDAVVQSGTLTIGSTDGDDGALNVGGTTTVQAGATLAYNRDNVASINLSGSFDGAGTITNLNTAALNITGAGNVATANLVASGGNITVASGAVNGLGDSTNVTVNAGRTLTLNNASETVGSVTLAGTGSTAGTIATVTGVGQLITGTLASTGFGSVALPMLATTVNVPNGGALALTPAGSLGPGAAVNITTGGSLTLGAAATVNTLNSGGLLGGAFTLTTTGGSTLSSGAVLSANLATAALNVTGNSTLNGTLSGAVPLGATALTLNGGVLTLGSAGRLATGLTDVVISATPGSGLTLGGAESVASFTSAGALGGNTHVLTSSSGHVLQSGAVVNTPLGGSSALVVNGTASLNRAAATNTVTINNGGALTVGTAGVLSDTATVGVAAGGTLNMAQSDTITRLNLSGTLSGSGTLRATGPTGYVLTGGRVEAPLGDGALSASGSSVLAAAAAVGSVDILAGGTLAFEPGSSFSATPTFSVAGTLALVSDLAIGSLSGAGSVNLGAFTLTTGSAAIGTTFSGLISGSGGLTKVGGSTFTLAASQAYTGLTTVSAGTLAFAGSELLANASSVAVNGSGTLSLNGTETVNGLTVTGTGGVAGIGTLVADTIALNGGTTGATTAMVAGTRLTSTGTSTLNGTLNGDLRVSSGTLTLAGGTPRLLNASSALELQGGTLVLSASETVGSSTLAGTLNGPGMLTAGTHTLQTGGVVNANLGGSNLVVSGNASLAGTAAANVVNINTGTLTLAGTELLNNSAALTVASGAQLTLAGAETVGSLTLAGSLAGSGTLSAGGYTLNTGAATAATANLGTGTLTVNGNSTLAGTAAATTVDINGGTLALASANRLAAGATVTVDTGAALQLAGNQALQQINVDGSVGGTGVLTATATNGYVLNGGAINVALGGGGLSATGNSSLGATAAVSTVNVAAGSTLAVGAGASFSAAPAVTVAATGALSLASAQTFGSLAGSGSLALGSFTLSTGNSTNTTFDGTLSGSGGLVKQGTGNFTLGGSQAYGGSTRVQQGTLTTAGANVLPDGSAVTVDSGTTLALGGSDTVASLALAGTLDGSGTLTGGSYTLGAGASTTATANLGIGTLTVAGSSTLAGSAAATTVNINTGTLSLAAADRLADNAAVAVASGATLNLGGADTVGSLVLAGTLGGTGQALTAATTTLQSGATVNADLAGATLNVTGAATLNGTAANNSINVNNSTLTLVGAERLNNVANVVVANGATLLLGGTETVGTLTLAGTLGSAGQLLNASTYTLQTGASVLANLGAGTLTSTGSATLSGTAAANTVNVSAGTLTLGAADRLADTSTVNVAGGATLLLNGDDTVFRLALSGLLGGTGTLSASIYTLSGGTYNSPLGGGALTVSADSTLNATSAATSVTVEGGTLSLGAANRFTAAPAVTVDAGAGLTLGGAESFGSLAGAGTVTLNSFTLTNLGLADTSFTGSLGVAGDTGGLIKAGSGNFTVAGSGAYTGNTRVDAGTLTVAGTLASLSLDVNGGSLVLTGADRLADSAAVAVRNGALMTLAGNESIGSLALTGTLGVSTGSTATLSANLVALDSGLVTANLGGGTLTSTGTSRLDGTSAATTLAVNGGTLTLAGADRLTAAPAATVAGGATLLMQGALTLGSLAGSGTTELGSFTLTTGSAGDSSYSGLISGSGDLVKTGASVFTLGGSHSYTGRTSVLGGTLATSGANVLPDGSAVTVAGGTTLTLGGNDSVASLVLGGNLNGSGTLTAATYALNGGSAATALGAGELSSTGNSSLAATSAATAVAVNGGTLSLAAANLLADTATLSVASGATLALGGNDNVGSLALAGTLAGSGTLTAASYTLAGATVNANLGAGTLASSGSTTLAGTAGAGTVQVNGGTLSLATAGRLADSAQVAVVSGATLRLNGDDTIGSLALAGTLDGSGRLSATSIALTGGNVVADVGATTLNSSGASSLAGGANVGALNVDNGTLTLAGTAVLSATSATTVATGATLALGGDQALGTLAGAGSLVLGNFTLTTGSGGSSSFDGIISGSGGLNKAGAGTFTLGGANSYTGATTVLAGTLATSGANVLPDTSATSVASGATLQLGGNDGVATLLLNGTLQGNATLTAATYTLDGGNALANLGSGRLISTGNSTLAGTAASAAVEVNSGTLLLATANRLADTATVAIASGATLQLGGDDTIASASIAGTLAGTGTLNAATVALASGRVDTALAGGVLSSSGNSQLNASSAATTVNVDGGSLTLGAAQRLTAAPAVTLAAGSSLALAGDETLNSLAGAGALVLNNSTLRTGSGGSSSYAGSITGSGSLIKQGSGVFTVSGAHGYDGSTTVEAGTLALAAANRLPDGSAVTVATGATLALAGDETVASLALAGTLGGSGTLSAGSYALDGGTAIASLGAGTLRSAGSSRLAGTSAANAVQVDSGTLTLAASDRLADSAAVAVASGATLALTGNDSVASLALAGTLAGSGTLSAATYSLDSGTVIADLGTGTLRSAGSSRLDGRSTATTLTVDGGMLTLGAADRLADTMAVSVANGAALLINATDTVASLTLAGTLAGSGTLTAASTLLDGGRADANLGTGTLTSRGGSTLAGTAAASSVVVDSGTLTLASAQRLVALPTLQVNSGATLAFGGEQSLGSLAGAGNVALNSFTLNTGSGGDSTFAGVISGSGGLVKVGSSSVFTLTGANSYTGITRINAGTLRVGNGGTSGSLATSAFETTGALSLVRSDDVTLTQPVSGSGSVEQAGNGRLLFSGNNKTYTGDTVVTNGQLATAGADELPDGSNVRVAANGRLALGGRETVRGVDADGSIVLGTELVASGDLLMRGAVTSTGAVQLTAERLAAVNDGNSFGGTVSITARGELLLSSGVAAGAARDLVLGTVNAAAGGRIDGGALSLTGVTTVTGGTLSLVAAAPVVAVAPDAELSTRQATSLPIAFAGDVVVAEAGSRLNVAAGAGLSVVASSGGSVQLLNSGNSFLGSLSVVSGAPDTPWAANSTALSFGGPTLNYAVQSRVRIAGDTVTVGGDGIVADVVSIRADRLSTTGTAALVARMPFDSTAGTATALPALTLELTPAAFAQSFPFGAPGAEGGLRVSVGSREYGNRVLPLDAGYVTVLPRDGASGTTAVLLRGPVVNPSGGYRFFFDGAGSQTQIPVFYNGVLPTTPQVENSISATVAVSEGARKAGFDDAVRTENVAVRLRAGVIAEVGPAPSATQGTEGLRVPAACTPATGALLCAAAGT